MKENAIFLLGSPSFICDYSESNPEHFEDDESYIGRIVFDQMFELTGLTKPDWICDEPLENLYEKTAIDILGALVRKDAWFKQRSGDSNSFQQEP